MSVANLTQQDLERWLRRSYSMARCQARYRGETWLITWPEWYVMWTEDQKYLRKGTASDSLVCVRIDWLGDWTLDNVVIETRWDHMQRMSQTKWPVPTGARIRRHRRRQKLLTNNT